MRPVHARERYGREVIGSCVLLGRRQLLQNLEGRFVIAQGEQHDRKVLALVVVQGAQRPDIIPVAELLHPAHVGRVEHGQYDGIFDHIDAAQVVAEVYGPQLGIEDLLHESVILGELLPDLRFRHVEVLALVDHGRNLLPVGYVAVMADQTLEQRPVLADGAGADERIDLPAELAHQALLDRPGALSRDAAVGGHRAVGRGRRGDRNGIDEEFVLVDKRVHQAFDLCELHLVLAHRVDDRGAADGEGDVVTVAYLDILVYDFEHVPGLVIQKRQHGCHGVGQRIAVREVVAAAVDGIDAAAEKEVQALRILRRPIGLGVIVAYLALADQYGVEPRITQVGERDRLFVGGLQFVGPALLAAGDVAVVGFVVLRGQAGGRGELRRVVENTVQVLVHLPVLTLLDVGKKLTPDRERLQCLFRPVVLYDRGERQPPRAALESSGYAYDEVDRNLPVALGHGFRLGDDIDRLNVFAFDRDLSRGVAFDLGEIGAVAAAVHGDPAHLRHSTLDVFDFGRFDRPVAGQMDVGRRGAALQGVRHGAGEHQDTECEVCDGSM